MWIRCHKMTAVNRFMWRHRASEITINFYLLIKSKCEEHTNTLIATHTAQLAWLRRVGATYHRPYHVAYAPPLTAILLRSPRRKQLHAMRRQTSTSISMNSCLARYFPQIAKNKPSKSAVCAIRVIWELIHLKSTWGTFLNWGECRLCCAELRFAPVTDRSMMSLVVYCLGSRVLHWMWKPRWLWRVPTWKLSLKAEKYGVNSSLYKRVRGPLYGRSFQMRTADSHSFCTRFVAVYQKGFVSYFVPYIH